MLDIVNKLFVLRTKSLLISPSNVLPYYLKLFFPFIIWIFTEGDGIKSRLPFKIFSTLKVDDLTIPEFFSRSKMNKSWFTDKRNLAWIYDKIYTTGIKNRVSLHFHHQRFSWTSTTKHELWHQAIRRQSVIRTTTEVVHPTSPPPHRYLCRRRRIDYDNKSHSFVQGTLRFHNICNALMTLLMAVLFFLHDSHTFSSPSFFLILM